MQPTEGATLAGTVVKSLGKVIQKWLFTALNFQQTKLGES